MRAAYLETVANAKKRELLLEDEVPDGLGDVGSAVLVDTHGTAGEDDALGMNGGKGKCTLRWGLDSKTETSTRQEWSSQ